MAISANIRCPSCQGALVPVALKCGVCDLTVTGAFAVNEFCGLGAEDLHFLRIFVHCEGRIREMEAALGVSYPTIKSRLAKLKETLAAPASVAAVAAGSGGATQNSETEAGILRELEAGRIGFEEARQKLKRLHAGEEK